MGLLHAGVLAGLMAGADRTSTPARPRSITVRLLAAAPAAIPQQPPLARPPLQMPAPARPQPPWPMPHIEVQEPAAAPLAAAPAPAALHPAPSPAAQPAAAPAPAPPQALLQVQAPALRYVVPPQPHYPRVSRRLGESGEVWVAVEIAPDGRVVQAHVERSSGFARLDESALAAVRAARFVPWLQDGVARGVRSTVPLLFDLQR